MRFRLMTPLAALVAAAMIAMGAGTAAAAPAPAAVPSAAAPIAGATAIPISQTVTNPTTGAVLGTFQGTFSPKSFSTSNGQLIATGLLSGTFTPATGGAPTAVSQTTSAPASVVQASCTILDLTLGPLHLDLLGLVVDLNQVHLKITAVPGPGNLLGNLLCGVANLLNGGSLGGLANLLNAILALLQGL